MEPWRKSLFDNIDGKATPNLRYGSSIALTANSTTQDVRIQHKDNDPPGILLTPIGNHAQSQTFSTADPFTSILRNSDLTNQALLRLLTRGNEAEPRRSTPNVARLTPKTFSGELAEAIDWFKEFVSIAEHSAWDQITKVRVARHYLKGDALNWFVIKFKRGRDISQLTAEDLPTWDLFKTEFLKEYRPPRYTAQLESQLARVQKSGM